MSRATDTYEPGSTGEIGVGGSQVQGSSSVAARMVMFKANAANTGVVYVGFGTGVTTADGSTDTTTGFQLSAGQDTGWLPTSTGDLSNFFLIASAASQAVTYMTLT